MMKIDDIAKLGKTTIKRKLYYKGVLFGVHSKKYCNSRAYILAYHSVCPRTDPYLKYIGSSLSILPDDFDRQIAHLVKHYKIVSLTQLTSYIADGYDGKDTLVAITFDDGYRDNYRYAYPILNKYNAPATFYVVTSCIARESIFWNLQLRYMMINSKCTRLEIDPFEKAFDIPSFYEKLNAAKVIKEHLITLPRLERERFMADLLSRTGVQDCEKLLDAMLSWEEIFEMRGRGMEFGSHTLSHPSLPYIPNEEAKQEVSVSKKMLEEHLDEPVIHFCYPNPGAQLNFNQKLSNMLRDTGYLTSVTSQNGYVHKGDSLWEMKRKGIYKKFSALPDFYFCLEKEAIMDRWDKWNISRMKNKGFNESKGSNNEN